MTEPLRLWRFSEAPQEFQDLSNAGGGEIFIAHVPAAWLTVEAALGALPQALWMLLDPGPRRWQPEQDLWGRVQRVPLAGGSMCVIVARS